MNQKTAKSGVPGLELRLTFANSAPYACVFLLVLAANAWSLAASDGPATLTGRWRSVEIPAGGVGALIEFHDNGTIDFSPGTALTVGYRVEGDTLVLATNGAATPGQKQKMVWVSESKLVLMQKTGDAQGETILRRATPSEGEARSLIGEWITEIEMPERTVSGRYLFRKDGTLLLVVSFLTEHGIYRTDGAHIHWELPEQPPADGAFRIEENVLTLPKPGGGTLTLKRY